MSATRDRPGFAAALVLSVTLALAVVLGLMAAQLLVIHHGITGVDGVTGLFNQQNQKVKTDLYVGGFLVILPLSLIAGSRLVDIIAAGPNGQTLPAFASTLAGALAVVLIAVRLSGALPWGSGVKGILVGVVAWSALAAAATARVVRRRWPALHRLAEHTPVVVAVTAGLLFGVLLCVTSGASLTPLPLILGALVSILILAAYGRVSALRVGRAGLVLDAVVVAILLLAIPDVIVFRNPAGIPNFLFDPGLVQFQQDWLLGPTNQLLGGGALLVNDPLSQYGVGMIYFLAGWFHIAPIGYGTLGFLDSLLTALFYAAAYGVLRLAGVRRLLAIAAVAIGVLALVYHFQFYVGQLPEEGPLRFGLPMIVLLGGVASARSSGGSRVARHVVLGALGVSALWALEAFAYTAVTYAAVLAAEAWLGEPGSRRPRFVRGALYGLLAVVVAHVVFAVATLIGSGHLPDWGQYLAYLREFLFGGTAGTITYGFANWSPGLAVDAAALVSAAALILLVLRKPTLARADPPVLVGLAGSTAYSIALLSYTDNRSSTYLLLYVALPLVIAATLWLALILAPASRLPRIVRRSALASALTIVVLLLSAAWPTIGGHFSRTALARAYPNGGLTSALHRLWHPPPIDPRAPVAIALLDRYMPGRRAVILLPTLPDLGTEIVMRSHRANLLPIGDPKADGLVSSVWLPRVRSALARLKPGQRILIDDQALKVIADMRRLGVNPLHGAIDGGGIEVEWILRELDRRWRIEPIHSGPDGFIVAELVPR